MPRSRLTLGGTNFYEADIMEEATLQFIAAQLRKPEGDEGVQMGARMNEGNYHINEHAIEALSAHEQDRVLEIGMGNGFFVPRLLVRYPGIQYTGCDFSPEMVKDAGRRNNALVRSGQVQFLEADAADLPFPDNSFDKVFTVNTLYFWPDPARTLGSIRRVLTPGGSLLIAIRPKELMQHMPFVKYGFMMYDAPDVEALLADNGFEVLETIVRDEPEQELEAGRDTKVATLIVIAKAI